MPDYPFKTGDEVHVLPFTYGLPARAVVITPGKPKTQVRIDSSDVLVWRDNTRLRLIKHGAVR